ncbi:ribonuclease P protein component [Nocardioides sp. R-C-SC26]|uniref:ribonuclease P protein component n=1 Tax=Nocardioides sp. R-C-SC26 TaxID=2870414 RepID=UPI001E618BE8|nr:ribonuclease P protein component [Nocardioides sp. R-C-SC26]
MLAAHHRLTDASSYRATTRRGKRAARSTLVVHLCERLGSCPDDARFGFVVSRAVGNSVVRNRVKRRLRHAAAELIRSGAVMSSSDVVVRALPASSSASYDVLAGELADAVARAGSS